MSRGGGGKNCRSQKAGLADEPHPVKRTVKKYKISLASSRALLAAFLCGEVKRVLFHRRLHAQITLDTSCVVIMDVVLNHLNEFPLTGELSAVIALPFQDAPKALHRAVINAMRHAGHTLRHPSLHKLVVEGTVGVLEPSVTMEQRMRVRIGFHSLIKGLENQRIVIAFAEHIGHNAPIAKVEDGAQIELLYLHTLKPLEFGHIGKPLFIGLCGIKLPVQKVFGKILRIFCVPGAATVVIFHGRAYISGPADAEHPFVIDMDTSVMAQIVVEPPVSLIRAFLVELFELFSKPLILCGPLAHYTQVFLSALFLPPAS